MPHYQIEKYVGKEDNPKSFDEKHGRYDWILAWGFKPRTYPKVHTDKEAIEVFKKETSKVKKGAYRLISIANGLGYSSSLSVISSVNCNDSDNFQTNVVA